MKENGIRRNFQPSRGDILIQDVLLYGIKFIKELGEGKKNI